MNYKVSKFENQALMFNIKADHNGKEVTFNVVCATDETEIPDLVAHYCASLDAPPTVYATPVQPEPVDTATLIQEQRDVIDALVSRVAQLESRV